MRLLERRLLDRAGDRLLQDRKHALRGQPVDVGIQLSPDRQGHRRPLLRERRRALLLPQPPQPRDQVQRPLRADRLHHQRRRGRPQLAQPRHELLHVARRLRVRLVQRHAEHVGGHVGGQRVEHLDLVRAAGVARDRVGAGGLDVGCQALAVEGDRVEVVAVGGLAVEGVHGALQLRLGGGGGGDVVEAEDVGQLLVALHGVALQLLPDPGLQQEAQEPRGRGQGEDEGRGDEGRVAGVVLAEHGEGQAPEKGGRRGLVREGVVADLADDAGGRGEGEGGRGRRSRIG